MNRQKTVPTGYVKSILQQFADEGMNVDELLNSIGIERCEIDESEHFSAQKFGALYQRIMTVSQDEYFGLLSGGKLPNGTFRMMCHAIIHASTLGSAIHRASDFHEICRGADIKPYLSQKSGKARLSFSGLDGMSEQMGLEIINRKPRTTVCTTLSMWHHFMSWLIGQKVELIATHFHFAETEALPNCPTIFRSDVLFDQPESSIIFDAQYLDYPLIQTEATLHSFLKTAPYQLVAMVNEAETLGAQITALIGRDCSIPPPTAEQAAKSLNISLSTLRRRLLEEGTNFQKIKDETRKKTAVRYIKSPQLAIGEVAALMGFDEISAFYRSFKRWTSMTPTEFRQQNKITTLE